VKRTFIAMAILLAAIFFTPITFHAAAKPLAPSLIITAEYTPYKRLMEPDLVELFRKYKVGINLFVRNNQLNDDLDRLYGIYEKANVPIIFQPLLPIKDGLYLNKRSVGVYLDYLDVVFAWAESHHHKIQALMVDIEPTYVELAPGERPPGILKGLSRLRKDLGRESFDASIPQFRRVIDKIHAHDAIAVAATFPYVIDDRMKGRHSWEDLFGGPVATLDWDFLAIMMYTSWYVEFGKGIGMDWDAAHYLAYDYAKDMKAIWGDRAGVAVGVTNSGQGHEKVIYTSAAQIAPAIAAVRAAGIEKIGIYDLKGILESGDPESWFKVLSGTPPQVPKKGARPAKRMRRIFRTGGSVIELMR